MLNKNESKTKYVILKGKKQGMSQMFDSNSKLISFTTVKVDSTFKDDEFFKGIKYDSKIKLVGYTKGRGYAGGMKRWNFRGGPATHGQKDTARSVGSIGTQGQGHVVKGRKMPVHYGNEKVSFITYYISYDDKARELKVKGGVPGARNSNVFIYFEKSNEN